MFTAKNVDTMLMSIPVNNNSQKQQSDNIRIEDIEYVADLFLGKKNQTHAECYGNE